MTSPSAALGWRPRNSSSKSSAPNPRSRQSLWLGSVVLKGWDPLSGLPSCPVSPETKSSDGMVDVSAIDVDVVVDAAIDVEVVVDASAIDVEVVVDAAIDVEVVVDVATDVEVVVDAIINVEVVTVVPVVSSLPEVATADASVTTASEADVVVGTTESEVSTTAGEPPQAAAISTQARRAPRDFVILNRIP